MSPIRLWCVFYRDIVDEALLTEYWELLSEPERIQQRRFYFEDDRRRYLLTRVLLRTVLSRQVTSEIGPAEWTFAAGQYGRPYITNEHPGVQNLSFNISHTKGLIILALAQERGVGVDTEGVSGARPLLDIADRFFAPAEVASLVALPASEQPQRFFEYWTLKEAYIKARGMGLAIPLDHFSFHFPSPEYVELSVDPRQGDRAERWRFWQFWVKDTYLAAVCAERVPDGAGEIMMAETVPLVSEEALGYRLIRASR